MQYDLAGEGRVWLREVAFRLLHHRPHPLAVPGLHRPLAGGQVRLRGKPPHCRQKRPDHVSSCSSGAPRRLDQQIVRLIRYLGIERTERIKFPVSDRQHRSVIVAEAEGPLANLVHIGGDAPCHAAQELFCLGHGLLLPLPLFHQRVDKGPLFGGI